MDVALLVLGATIGLSAGLICRRNNIHILPTYRDMDMAVIGKKAYYT
jgi:hypothetical protein